MKNRVLIITKGLMLAGLLAVATFVSVEQKTLAAEPPTDPAHVAHVAAAASQAGGQTVDAQLAELRAKMHRLEAIIQQQSGSSSGAKPMQGKMAGMSGTAVGNPPSGSAPGPMKPTGDMGGMGGAASPPGGEMGMMDKMMSMGGGAMPVGAPMAGGGMMGGMGGKGGPSTAMPSALPGFPGATHLYHVGATGFFLDHPQHIALSTEQQMMLNQIKEQAALDKASASRSVQEAEQDLWKITAADQPDNTQIEAKVAEIEKLRGDARLRFIGAVGGTAKILTDEQRKILTGSAPPVSAAPAAAPKAGGMKNM